MRVRRWIEAISGILASLAGAVALVRLLTGPGYSGEGCRVATPGEPPVCVTTTATLVQVNGAAAAANLVVVAALLAGVGIAAVWHSRTGRRGGRTLLWTATATLAAYTVLSMFSIGGFLLPSVALALISCACSFGRQSVAV